MKALWAGRRFVALVGNCRQRGVANDERASAVDETVRLRGRENP